MSEGVGFDTSDQGFAAHRVRSVRIRPSRHFYGDTPFKAPKM